MAIFDRMRRARSAARHDAGALGGAHEVPLDRLPAINQRISVTTGDHVPVPSRVEDAERGALVIAEPALAVEPGDPVLVSWESDGAWSSFTTRVLQQDRGAAVPTVTLDTRGRISVHDERRLDQRRAVDLPTDLRVVSARALKPGRDLQVRTTELSGNAVRFSTSAPFAPGDEVEARIGIGEGVDDVVGARVRVIRVDSVSGSWRSAVTASIEEILRSDRARLIAVAATASAVVESAPPTADGVGGRDEPEHIDTLDRAVEWLRRRG